MSPPTEDANDWERWRGKQTALAEGIDEKIDTLFTLLDEHVKDDKVQFKAIDEKIDGTHRDIAAINGRIAKWSGMVGAAVVVLGWIVPEIVRKFL